MITYIYVFGVIFNLSLVVNCKQISSILFFIEEWGFQKYNFLLKIYHFKVFTISNI